VLKTWGCYNKKKLTTRKLLFTYFWKTSQRPKKIKIEHQKSVQNQVLKLIQLLHPSLITLRLESCKVHYIKCSQYIKWNQYNVIYVIFILSQIVYFHPIFIQLFYLCPLLYIFHTFSSNFVYNHPNFYIDILHSFKISSN